MTFRTLRAAAVGIALAGLFVAVGAAAQPGVGAPPFDEARYNELIGECDAILQRVRLTLDGGDHDMAALFLDLGWSSCTQARRALARAEGSLDEAVLSAHLTRSLSLAELLVETGGCTRAAEVFSETLSLVDPLPLESARRSAALAHAVLRCLPPGGLEEDQRVDLWEDGVEEWLDGQPRAFVWRDDRFATCPGTFSHPPSYRVSVAEPGRVTVELQARGDWRLAVRGPEGVFCGSGGDGVFWLELNAQAADYDVFVGWAGADPPRDHYRLGLSLRIGVGGTTGPSHGIARLSLDQLETHLRGHTIGVDDALERFGAGCAGYVPAVPNHRIELAGAADVVVSVRSPMSGELTLVLQGAGGVRCAGPGPEGDTELSLRLEPGEYDLFVGEPSPWGTGYEASFAVVGGPLLTEPRLARLTLPADGSTHTFTGRVPASPAEARTRPDCVGSFHVSPDVTFDLTERGTWGVMARSPNDACLVVVGPEGSWCNDDFSGSDPGIFRALEPGEYQVFVGARGTPSGFGYELSVVRD